MIDRDGIKSDTIVLITGEKPTDLFLEDYQTDYTDNLHSTISMLEEKEVDVVVFHQSKITSVDYKTLRAIRRQYPLLELLIVTKESINEDIFQSLIGDNTEILTHPVSNQQLTNAVKRAARQRKLAGELLALRSRVAMSYGYDNIIGISQPISTIKTSLTRVAPTDITILISGPAGSGKKLFANTIHHHSNRRKAPFVVVDCSVLPEHLIGVEIFGDSSVIPDNNQSSLERADGGTLFIAEIDRLPHELQARLAAFMQNFQITQSDSVLPKKVDIRIIVSSGRDLQKMTEEGSFRKDLLRLIDVFPLKITSLDQRPEDIEPLADYFLRRFSHEMNRSISISRSAMDLLVSYDWPGNVRELETTLHRAAISCRNNEIEAADLRISGIKIELSTEDETQLRTSKVAGSGLLADNQRSVIEQALKENNWNFTQTAQELGIGRTTLWRKVKKYNLKRDTVYAEMES